MNGGGGAQPPKIPLPQQRLPGSEAEQFFAAQQQLAGPTFQLESQYQPAYANLSNRIQYQSLLGAPSLVQDISSNPDHWDDPSMGLIEQYKGYGGVNAGPLGTGMNAADFASPLLYRNRRKLGKQGQRGNLKAGDALFKQDGTRVGISNTNFNEAGRYYTLEDGSTITGQDVRNLNFSKKGGKAGKGKGGGAGGVAAAGGLGVSAGSAAGGGSVGSNTGNTNLIGTTGLSNAQKFPGWINTLEDQVNPRLSRMQADAERFARRRDIEDVEKYGARAAAAFKSANPELYSQMDKTEAFINNNIGPNALETKLINDALTADKTAIQKQLEQQAQDELALGGKLSEQELRDLDQSERAAFNSRGLVRTNRAIGSELLSRDAATRARMRERQGFAQTVDASGFGQTTANRNFGMGAQNLYLDRVKNNQDATLQLAQMRTNTRFDPFNAVLGRSSNNVATGINALGLGQSAKGAGSQYFSPFNSYAGQLYGQNNEMLNSYNDMVANQQYAAANSAANNKASQQAGILSGAVGLGVGALSLI